MKNFKAGNKFGGGAGAGKRSFGGNGGGFKGGDRKPFGRGGNGGGYESRPQQQMYPTICDECGQACEVPFRPSGDRPIYCKNCFQNNGGPSSTPEKGSREYRDNGAQKFQPNRDNGQKTMVYQPSPDIAEIKKLLFAISTKLDTLTSQLGASQPAKSEPVTIVEQKEEKASKSEKKNKKVDSKPAKKAETKKPTETKPKKTADKKKK